ncbi:MAG TPA: hypothetical protein PKB14_16220 [Rubrivivax sp.]|nr:hypothetical protein [Rubrivivax sp.]
MTGPRMAGALALATLLLLQACASRGPRPADATLDAAPLAEERARQIVAVWQRRLLDYIEQAGDGDPAVLAQLPAQRASGTLRPARIVFAALDVEASAEERDGFDVQGLLLGALNGTSGTSGTSGASSEPYLFVVGIVQREGYRPVALVDIRLVALGLQGGTAQWTVGDGDAQALQRYRARLDASAPLHFPADADRFERAPCAPRLCANERLSTAHWSVEAPPTVAAAPPPR